MAELRRDLITREWVNIASERGTRPSDFRHHEEARFVRVSDHSNCPFCPGNEHMSGPERLRYTEGDNWTVRVIPNKFPAFAGDGNAVRTRRGVYEFMPAGGEHEILVETPEHHMSLAHLSVGQVHLVLKAYRERYVALRRDPHIKYILICRNHGRVAGASIEHGHSQIIGTPIIPQAARLKIEGVQRYNSERQACVYCDIVAEELRTGTRLVATNGSFVAYAPFASRHPFETWIIPRKRDASFVATDDTELMDLAGILKETLLRLDLCLEDPPYNLMVLTTDFSDEFHWHIEIIPRLSIAAGFELGTGIYINTVPPERAAAYLRAVDLGGGADAMISNLRVAKDAALSHASRTRES